MNALEVAAANSPWARVNVGEKVLLILGLLVLAISLPPLPALPIIAAVLILLAVSAKVPPRLYAGLILAPATFILLGLGPLVFSVSTSGLRWIDGGLVDAATVLARTVVGMSATMLFALTTPMSEQLVWFRSVGVPAPLVHITMLTYRMTGTLITTARTMWEAQAARLGHSSRRRWIHSVAGQAASLFVLSFSRARALQEGMELRADISEISTLHASRPVRWSVIIGTVALLAAVAAIGLIFR
ncbi:cobalt ECF transporter T component CbiQ [Corynebacterium sp. TAE3-ERU16]|uniref:cobalt ECF transporter T component CbiQ n=1 Tax=Corynebacterium sp. TAE3-ERU16 TaxID=2849493 RepID=UPI001C45D04B|nr:cobalt ECF transporter T component CbiQ [Corynebacterium sp. TAE3-ERU16]MBV7294290.1 cobalt ECF transporter T component CbiQ [Corynebacterium sp. TAE3-ERU16]